MNSTLTAFGAIQTPEMTCNNKIIEFDVLKLPMHVLRNLN